MKMEWLSGFSMSILKVSEGFLYVTFLMALKIDHNNLLTASKSFFLKNVV